MVILPTWPDMAQIALQRKKLGISQQELSQMSGVAQPVISRIESGSIENPSYDVMKRIFEVLEASQRKRERKPIGASVSNIEPLRASDLMSTKLVSVEPHSKVKETWALMKERGYSQLPVISESGRILGAISESSLALADMDMNSEVRVEDIMNDPFPIVGKDTKLPTIVAILKIEPAVLIADRGKATGIITRYDLVENVLGSKD